MKTLTTIIFLSLAIGSAHAAKVEDVSVLDVQYKKDNFVVKLQTKDGKKDSYFTVDIVREDVNAFEKLGHMMQKMKKPDLYKVDLDIPSFSAHPSGAYYKSTSVKVSGGMK